MNNFFKKVWKSTVAYVVGSLGFIQLASVILDNISTEDVFGTSSEVIMQTTFLITLVRPRRVNSSDIGTLDGYRL